MQQCNCSGADPALNLTGAKTENGQGTVGTGHRRCSALAAGGMGAAQGPLKPKGFRCSEMHSQPFLAIKIINSNDLLFKKFHFISSIFYQSLLTTDLCNGFHNKRVGKRKLPFINKPAVLMHWLHSIIVNCYQVRNNLNHPLTKEFGIMFSSLFLQYCC